MSNGGIGSAPCAVGEVHHQNYYQMNRQNLSIDVPNVE